MSLLRKLYLMHLRKIIFCKDHWYRICQIYVQTIILLLPSEQNELFLSRHFLSIRRDSASKQIVLWFILKTEASRVYPTSKKSCKSFGAIWVQKWGLWELLLFLHIVVVALGANGGLKPEVIWGFPDLTSQSHFEQS